MYLLSFKNSYYFCKPTFNNFCSQAHIFKHSQMQYNITYTSATLYILFVFSVLEWNVFVI